MARQIEPFGGQAWLHPSVPEHLSIRRQDAVAAVGLFRAGTRVPKCRLMALAVGSDDVAGVVDH